jgi:glycosyltransferase involved in cell wall biosynthesis
VIAWPAFINRQQNSYNALLYSELANLGVQVDDFYPQRLIFGRYDVWHIHWPESILNLPRLWQALPLAFVLRFLLRVARARGIKIVWTAHNLRSHEGLYPRVETQLWRALLGQVDGFIALTEARRSMALRRFPALRGRPSFVIPHGPYRASYPDTLAAEDRAQLDLPQDAPIFVALGQIRPYKNLPHLIRTFRHLPD